MKLNNLIIEMKNIFGVEINNEEKVKEEIINFCLLKMELFKTDKNKGSELIFEVLNYINKYFVFNQKNELTEIKDNFLEEYKKELFVSLNPENFKTLTTYGRQEFYFHIEDILKIIYFFSYNDNRNKNHIKEYGWLENFKLNKKSVKKQEENIFELIKIFNKKEFNLKDIKMLDEIYFCDNTKRGTYFLAIRNTGKVNSLKKEKKAIENYFKEQEPDFSEILNYLKEKGFTNEEVGDINKILIEFYSF